MPEIWKEVNMLSLNRTDRSTIIALMELKIYISDAIVNNGNTRYDQGIWHSFQFLSQNKKVPVIAENNLREA